MLKLRLCLSGLCCLAFFIGICNNAFSQEVGFQPGHYYEHRITSEQQPMPLTHVRENDVVWETCIWRTINLREKFNQFFYFPIERKGAHGRQNFAYMLWDAMARGDIPIYADDEFKIPIDNFAFVERYTRADTMYLEVIDEEDEESFEYQTVLIPKDFSSEDVLQVKLKEAWYIEKQETGQYVRILGLALAQDMYKEVDGDREFQGTINLFWIPMLSPQVRTLFARKEAYYEDNIAHLPTWLSIFTERMFDTYVTRVSNTFNRAIIDYLTGEDAILESERIEDHLLDISMDQWEW